MRTTWLLRYYDAAVEVGEVAPRLLGRARLETPITLTLGKRVLTERTDEHPAAERGHRRNRGNDCGS